MRGLKHRYAATPLARVPDNACPRSADLNYSSAPVRVNQRGRQSVAHRILVPARQLPRVHPRRRVPPV